MAVQSRISAILPFVLLLTGLALPQISSAAPLLSLSIGLPVNYIGIHDGAQMDFPIYLEENRDANADTSLFQGPYPPEGGPGSCPGPFTLADIGAKISTTQSKIVSYTPVSGFDGSGNSIFLLDDQVNWYTQSTAGIPVQLDNSGITGRTDILIGTLRVVVGAPIPFNGKNIILDLLLADHAGGASSGCRQFLCNGIQRDLGGFATREIRIFAEDIVTPTPTPTPTPRGPGHFTTTASRTYTTFDPGTYYPNFACKGDPGALCTGKAEFYDPASVKKVKKVTNTLPKAKTIYAKCSIPNSNAPNGTYCIMKLSSSAKAIVKRKKKLKGNLSFVSSGLTKPATTTMTVK